MPSSAGLHDSRACPEKRESGAGGGEYSLYGLYGDVQLQGTVFYLSVLKTVYNFVSLSEGYCRMIDLISLMNFACTSSKQKHDGFNVILLPSL